MSANTEAIDMARIAALAADEKLATEVVVVEPTGADTQVFTKIAGVERFESFLILSVEKRALAVREAPTLTCVNIGRHQAAVLPLIDRPAKCARGEAL